jgi:hypothetical protein
MPHKVLLMNGSAKGGILFNCFVAQSVEATNVRRNNFAHRFTAGIIKIDKG